MAKEISRSTVTIGNNKLLQTANAVIENEIAKIYEFDYGAQWSDDTAKSFLNRHNG
ncbi:hypothetical protein [Chryseobacterium gallinarum]|uniref:hypothetical protein n=1 Tax=Chryseobacterium gallinarum TaxID=1324352 RepID=UPI000ACE7016|nr:hypothetical protein [Chryseobacterium gallinarum]